MKQGSIITSVSCYFSASRESAPHAPGKSRRLAGIRSRISIEELKSVYKRQLSQTQEDNADPLFDPMAKVGCPVDVFHSLPICFILPPTINDCTHVKVDGT